MPFQTCHQRVMARHGCITPGSKQAVPERQGKAVIAIMVGAQLAVMDAVHFWRDQQQAQRPGKVLSMYKRWSLIHSRSQLTSSMKVLPTK